MTLETKSICRFTFAVLPALCLMSVSSCGTSSRYASEIEDGIYFNTGDAASRTTTFSTIEKREKPVDDGRARELAERTASRNSILLNGTLKQQTPSYNVNVYVNDPYWYGWRGYWGGYWGWSCHIGFGGPYWGPYWYDPWGPYGPYPYYPYGPYAPYGPWVPYVPVVHSSRGLYVGPHDAVGSGIQYSRASGGRDYAEAVYSRVPGLGFKRDYDGGTSSGGRADQIYRRPEGIPSGRYTRDASYGYGGYSRSGYSSESSQGGTYGRSAGYEGRSSSYSGYTGGYSSGSGFGGGGRSGSGGYGGGSGGR